MLAYIPGRGPESQFLITVIFTISNYVSNVILIGILPFSLHINSIVNSSSYSVNPMVNTCGVGISNYLSSIKTASFYESFGTSIVTIISQYPKRSDSNTPNFKVLDRSISSLMQPFTHSFLGTALLTIGSLLLYTLISAEQQIIKFNIRIAF